MTILLYGGVPERVALQQKCDHQWHGPCIDDVSRYNKCTKCFCLERDLRDEKDLWKAEKVAADLEKERRGTQDGGAVTVASHHKTEVDAATQLMDKATVCITYRDHQHAIELLKSAIEHLEAAKVIQRILKDIPE